MTKRFDLSSAGLHILAMGLMLLDHMWATVMTGNDWMTCAGRLAFPIFAFLIAEGYTHTRDVRKYMKRMLIFALIAEIPFNLMTGGVPINPVHQNVLWTFLIALQGIRIIERAKDGSRIRFYLTAVLTVLVSWLIGMVTMVDYMGYGVVTVYIFYFLRRRDIIGFLGQFALLWLINWEMLGGFVYPVEIFGGEILISRQGLAVLALIPIWLYRGRQGYHAKWFKTFCYAFYPAHMLVLWLIATVMG